MFINCASKQMVMIPLLQSVPQAVNTWVSHDLMETRHCLLKHLFGKCYFPLCSGIIMSLEKTNDVINITFKAMVNIIVGELLLYPQKLIISLLLLTNVSKA
jgi:hypothetical protein